VWTSVDAMLVLAKKKWLRADLAAHPAAQAAF
jgi:hypothetical protein